MPNKISFLLTCILTLFCFNVFGQTTENPDDHTDHHEHHHNEIGVANAPVYFVDEEEFAYGLHIHYIRNISHSKFGFGLGYERIFDKHKHNTLGLLASYRPIEKLSLNVSPGVTFEDHSSEYNFAFHLESAYEFELRNFHLGPALEFAWDPEDFHISLGIHIGYGF